jgi:hypothetical protein
MADIEDGQYNRQKLHEAVVAASNADYFDAAKQEWTYSGSVFLEPEQYNHCVCGHKINQLCTIRNKTNGKTLVVGSKCVDQFGEKILAKHTACKRVAQGKNKLCMFCKASKPAATGTANDEANLFVCCVCSRKHSLNCECGKAGTCFSDVSKKILCDDCRVVCKTCEKPFQPEKGKEWAKDCKTCWTKNQEVQRQQAAVASLGPNPGDLFSCPSCSAETVRRFKENKRSPEICRRCYAVREANKAR